MTAGYVAPADRVAAVLVALELAYQRATADDDRRAAERAWHRRQGACEVAAASYDRPSRELGNALQDACLAGRPGAATADAAEAVARYLRLGQRPAAGRPAAG